MADRRALTPRAVVLLQQLLHDPDVQAVHIEEPGAAQPVEVGVLRRSSMRMSWHHGPDLAHALRLALACLRPATPAEIPDA